jgi:O-antigen/teichoic acid export membrane protein
MDEAISGSIAGRTLRATLWMVVNSAYVRAASFIAQVLLASILSAHDFGVYAAAIALTALVLPFRGGGLYEWLTQGGVNGLDQRGGDTWWGALLTNGIIGLAICVLAWPAAGFFDEPALVGVLLVFGLTFPLITPGSFHRTVLGLHLRGREISIIDMAGASVRYPLMVALALLGLGPLSFVLPLPASYLAEWAVGAWFSRDPTWRRRSTPSLWGVLFWSNRWTLGAMLLFSISANIDFLTVGRLAPLAVLGAYFFAYQMTYMSATLVTDNARKVLFPALVAIPHERRAAAALQTTTVAVVLGAPFLLALGAVADPLEDLVWGGKWDAAVLAMQVFSLGLPIHFLSVLTQSELQSNGQYRAWAAFSGIRGIAAGTGAVAGCLLFPSETGRIAACVAAGIGCAELVQTIVTFHRNGIGAGHMLWANRSPLLIAPAALIGAIVTTYRLDLPALASCAVSLGALAILWVLGTMLIARGQISDSTRIVLRALGR